MDEESIKRKANTKDGSKQKSPPIPLNNGNGHPKHVPKLMQERPLSHRELWPNAYPQTYEHYSQSKCTREWHTSHTATRLPHPFLHQNL